MRDNEKGYIVVETLTCFVLFVFLNISILSLINIVTVQTRVHYALTQAAETLSMYSYTLEAAGVADHLVASAERGESVVGGANEVIDNVNKVINTLENLDIEGAQEAGQAIYDQASGFAGRLQDDPRDVLQDFMNYGIQELSSAALGACIRPLVGWYLTSGELSGDAFLTAFQVENGLDGLQFYTVDKVSFDGSENQFTSISDSKSRFLNSQENIKLVVQYDINYTFGTLPLPFGKLHVTQEVMTKAWLNGHGEGYRG